MVNMLEQAMIFFQRYPQAKPLKVLADGQAFLNNFEDWAIRRAMLSNQILYEVDKNLVVKQIYPPLAPTPPSFVIYEALGLRPLSNLYCNESIVELGDDNSDYLELAILEVASLASIEVDSITLSETEDSNGVYFNIVIKSRAAVWKLKDAEGQIINFNTQ